jgi:hypothetical protein
MNDETNVQQLARMQRLVGTVLSGLTRRRAKRLYRDLPLWAVVCDEFGLGSTSAYALCREFGHDPEKKVGT